MPVKQSLLQVFIILSSISLFAQTPLKQWDIRYGGTADEGTYGFDLLQTSDEGFLITGYSASGIGGDKTQTSQGSTDYWIVRTDLNGVKLWDKRYGGTNEETLTGVVQTNDGSIE